jgi:DNA-binding MarR family transcriptional regulator
MTTTVTPDEARPTSSGEQPAPVVGEQPAPVVDAVVGASRALVAIAARSLGAAGEEVTLPQYRALVVLASRGPQRVVDLAGFLDVTASTATRMCDRLVRKGLIRRQRLSHDRRSVRVSISAAGRELVAVVTRRRRREVQAIVGRMSAPQREQLVTTLRMFAEAAGEVPEQDWSLGWGSVDD